jgi:hypothetical protein
MSELHTEDNVPAEISQEVDTGTVENGPDLATGEGDNPGEINQDAVQERINKATHLKHKAERATQAATKKAEDLQARLDAIESAKPAPAISDIPDREFMSDEEFTAAQAARDEQVRAAAAHSNAAVVRQQQAQQQQNDAIADQNRRVAESAQTYRNRATELKVTDEQLNTAANVINDYGMSNDVAQFILDDPNGPLITTYLAKNQSILQEMAQMSPMQAAVMISQKISPKFASTKPVNSQAPAPLDRIKGSGTAPKKRGAEGTQFE